MELFLHLRNKNRELELKLHQVWLLPTTASLLLSTEWQSGCLRRKNVSDSSEFPHPSTLLQRRGTVCCLPVALGILAGCERSLLCCSVPVPSHWRAETDSVSLMCWEETEPGLSPAAGGHWHILCQWQTLLLPCRQHSRGSLLPQRRLQPLMGSPWNKALIFQRLRGHRGAAAHPDRLTCTPPLSQGSPGWGFASGKLPDPACGSACSEKLPGAEELPACPTPLSKEDKFKHGLDTQREQLIQRAACSEAHMGLLAKKLIKKCLLLCKTGILNALAKDTGRRFSSLGPRELFLLGEMQSLAGMEKRASAPGNSGFQTQLWPWGGGWL